MQVRKEMSMERDYIERNAVLEEALSDKAVRGGLADETDIKRIIADVISADVVSVREYQELAGENRELKRLLKLAIEDIDNCSFCSMCANHNDENKCRKCKAITLDIVKWKHGDEAENLLKSETLAEFQPVIHAKWVRVRIYCDEYGCINEIFRCSNCEIPRDEEFSYFPSCGAKIERD